jgi:hypothetical protein
MCKPPYSYPRRTGQIRNGVADGCSERGLCIPNHEMMTIALAKLYGRPLVKFHLELFLSHLNLSAVTHQQWICTRHEVARENEPPFRDQASAVNRGEVR